MRRVLQTLIEKVSVLAAERLKYSRKRRFVEIYRNAEWGDVPGDGDKFCSGPGSREPMLYAPYIEKLNEFLRSSSKKKTVVDLGCGDFHVSNQVVENCGKYIGVDIVPTLIDRLREDHGRAGCEFLVLDIIDENLPDADCAILRQVLQHLTNREIIKILAKLKQYKDVIVTEHWPPNEDFTPNCDLHSTRRRTRRHNPKPSGVVLWAPPFGVPKEFFTEMCRVRFSEGVLVTYRISFGNS